MNAIAVVGMIFIYPVEEVIRIRTGERGQDALMYPGGIDARREAAMQAESVGVMAGA